MIRLVHMTVSYNGNMARTIVQTHIKIDRSLSSVVHPMRRVTL